MLPPQWSIQKPFDDFGIDGIVSVGTDSALLPLEFGVQIKSSRNFNKVNGSIVVPRISFDMLQYWLRKFLPTLLVAYDAKKEIGYYQWIQNLITYERLSKKQAEYYLHVESKRKLTTQSWEQIQTELEEFESLIRGAIHAKAKILPACIRLSSALSILCRSDLEDSSTREGFIRRVSLIGWTYIEVANEIDTLLPKMTPDTYAANILAAFRDEYFSKCREIIMDFDQLAASWRKEVGWIAMKKPEECAPVRHQLNAMVSECLYGLLKHA